LVMEYIDGPSLADLLKGGPLPVERAAVMGIRLADGLAHAHHLGIVHRDVKPGNVLVGSDGLARLADFGIARLTGDTTLTQTGWLVGTASYLAPEQLEGRHVGPRADIYSLGLVLLEATTGQRAYDGSPTEAAMARLVREPDIPESLPAWWRALVRDMTAVTPDDRPSAPEVSERLGEVESADETTTMRVVAPDPTQTMRLPVVEVEVEAGSASVSASRSWVPLAVIAGVVAALVLVGLALGASGDGGEADSDLPAPLRDALEQLESEVGS
ncbi:MAG: serine/threonine-protein kinase, partial [Actinomycetota bacterium]